MALALAALCRPAFLLWTLAAGVVFWRQAFQRYSTDHTNRGPTARGRFANGFRAPAAFALGALVVLSPWAIRNQLQFGRPIVTTTHGGYTMLLANNPEFYDWLRSGSWGSVWQADQFNADWNRRRPGDELRDDRQAYAEAWQTIRAEPGTFLRACAVRIGRFWSPLPHQVAADETPLRRLSRYAVALWYIAEFALAMLGICRICRLSPRACFDFRVKRGSPGVKGDSPIFADTKIGTVPFPLPPSTWLWGFLLVGCLLAGHVVYWTDMRMRAPAMPVVAIVAACGFLYRRECDHDAVKR